MGKASQRSTQLLHLVGLAGPTPVALAGLILTAGPLAGDQWTGTRDHPGRGVDGKAVSQSSSSQQSLGGCATFEATAQFWVALYISSTLLYF